MTAPFARRNVKKLSRDTKLTDFKREFFAFEWSASHSRTPEIHVFPDAQHRSAFVQIYPDSVETAVKNAKSGPGKTLRWHSRECAVKEDVVRVFNDMTYAQRRTMVVVHRFV